MEYNSKEYRILLVDDDKDTLDFMSDFLTLYYQVIKTVNAEDALMTISNKDIHLVVTDLMMPGMDGLELISRIKEIRPDLPILVVSGSATVLTAVQAMKAGAEEIIMKPLTDLKLVRRLIDRSLKQKWLEEENRRLQNLLIDNNLSYALQTRSKSMAKAVEMVERIAPMETSVLLTGETGTGKSLLAKVIHEQSNRKDRKFVEVNCGALAENLLESTLFGHKKGSFTGAVRERQGLFAEANGGTLFLDEISETSSAFQIKLLNVLEQGKIRKVGADEEINVDVRMIFATNRNLREAVESGEFRRDLFFRINVLNIRVPALRERQEDIVFIANAFLTEFCRKNSLSGKRFSPEVVKILNRYKWEGNVRELRNCIEYSVVMTKGEVIEPENLPGTVTGETKIGNDDLLRMTDMNYREAKEIFDKKYFDEILKLNMGNVTKTAEHSELARQFVYRKIAKLGLKVSDYRHRDNVRSS